ncbi:hypothetical protein [Candidatus Methanoperedens nitratireducens]|uniref:Uncharacterized protein n=1 Tax=Candidatus Methanoperedens nitratireducens TaxID=1392998 RepID=A0A284VME2_9EURY|nr:hypothetical protein [Candidatus Methanoperedens nitroreducens]SNQ60418.1 membrane hypothetical protein [Candidatus Methanoperedens nitroreducens]
MPIITFILNIVSATLNVVGGLWWSTNIITIVISVLIGLIAVFGERGLSTQKAKWVIEDGTWSSKKEYHILCIKKGTWEEGKGNQLPEGSVIGEWNGGGEMKSNVPDPTYAAAIVATIIGFISNVVSAALGLLVGVIGWITTIISIISIVAIIVFLVYLASIKKNIEGAWKVNNRRNNERSHTQLKYRHGRGSSFGFF